MFQKDRILKKIFLCEIEWNRDGIRLFNRLEAQERIGNTKQFQITHDGHTRDQIQQLLLPVAQEIADFDLAAEENVNVMKISTFQKNVLILGKTYHRHVLVIVLK